VTDSIAPQLFDLAAALCGAAGVLLLAGPILGRRRRRLARRHLQAFTVAAPALSAQAATPQRPLARILNQAGGIQRLLPERVSQALRRQITRAGQPGGLSSEGWLSLRIGVAAVAVVCAAAFSSAAKGGPLGLAGAALVLLLGLFSCDLYLLSRTGARIRKAEAELPTVLDLVSLSMAAGMGFDIALETILIRLRGPLAAELRRYLRDTNELGLARETALLDLSDRLGNAPDIHAFIDAINRANALGTGLLTAVSGQASLLRQERRRRAAASAQRAPVRMLIPMTLFMLPVLMMIVIGPIALRLFNVSQGVQP
jgi:tight adherence protein C